MQVQTEDTANIQSFNLGTAGAGNGNTFTDNNIGADFTVAQNSDLTFTMVNNSIVGSHSHAINAFSSATSGTGASITGKIQSNTIGTAGVIELRL